MNIIDYTGKINNHEEYIKVLNKIESKCKYIEIVIIDGRKNNELVDEFSSDILDSKKVSEWWGTKTRGSNNESLRRGDYCEITDFGLDDIAFYDKNANCLLCTTTHEGYIAISEKIAE